ncbi:MAG TPA: FAD-dependent oxidoreductase, partial [Thermoleophilia bacterium]|nr:FAD-dependent oxidoreductase [Thermoleophilia bacterium]
MSAAGRDDGFPNGAATGAESVKAERPLVLLCECAGTMRNVDFDALEARLAPQADVLRDTHWCARQGQARLLELMETDPRRPVFAGCSRDFSDRRFQRLTARGLRLEIADIREGCSWVHGDDTTAVTAKAERIVLGALRYPGAPSDTLARTQKVDGVLVIGGGVSGTQAAAELAQMGHRVELVERRPFLGGRAARIGTVFPTNDCGQCLPTTDAQAGTRKCFHRNVAIDDPNLHVWRRTTV